MKKYILILSIGSILLSSCATKTEKIDEDSIRLADLTAQYDEASNFNDSLMLLMGDIYIGLDSINMQEGLLYNMGAGDNMNRREEIRSNLSQIKARLNANKALLTQMEEQLKNSNNKNSIQTKTIEQLKAHIEQQDAKIAQLESELESARGEIANLNTQVTQSHEQAMAEAAAKEKAQQEAIAAENQANRVYYAIGTNKELKKNGLLEKKFLGATKIMKGDYNQTYFTIADKRTLTTIPTNSKKVKIWSNMPSNSYNITENADKTKTINITDPSKFWSITPYLIIQID